VGTILLLDEDSAFRSSAAVVLSTQGHQVVQCACVVEAARLLAAQAFDLVLTDGDGACVVRDQRSKGSRVPAVLVSRFWKRSDPEVLREGFDDVLHKPVTPAALVATVQKHTGGPMLPLAEESERALARLRRTYAQQLPTLIEGLREAIRQLHEDPDSMVVRAVVRRRAREIAGTAGSFGFGEVGAACALIESALFCSSGIGWDRIDAALRAIVPREAQYEHHEAVSAAV
jgi:CheY-like chemotaxis protein